MNNRNRDRSVGLVTRLRAGRPGFDFRQRLGIFLFATASRPALGLTEPPIQCVPEILSPKLKRLGCESNHSPLSRAEVKNPRSCTSTPPYVFIAWCLVYVQDTSSWRGTWLSSRTNLPLHLPFNYE